MATAAVIGGSALLGAFASDKASKRAAKASTQGADRARADLARSQAQARQDLFKLFPAAQENIGLGFQGALDVFGQSLPAQTDVFQQGNVGAQQALINALPQFQNAILGSPVDFSSFQPTQIQTPDLGFFQQQLPEFVNPFEPSAQSTGATRPTSGGGGIGAFGGGIPTLGGALSGGGVGGGGGFGGFGFGFNNPSGDLALDRGFNNPFAGGFDPSQTII